MKRRLAPWGFVLLLSACVPLQPEVKNAPYLEKAEGEFLLEQYGQAIGHYELFLSENPEHPERAKILGRIGKCHLGAGRPDLALRSFDQALALDPQGPVRWEIVFRGGVAHRLQGDVARALEAFRAVAAAPPVDRGRAVMDDELRYEHAMALFRAGDWKAGQAELAAVSPRGPFAARRQVRLGLAAYAVQVGAFTDERLARSQELRLKVVSPGGAVRLVEGERPFYVVATKSFSRYEDAQREAERLRGRGFTDAFTIP